MPRRYLFGPVNPAYADQHLRGPIAAGDCRVFDPSGSTGLAVGPADTWDDVCARLPDGWRPDFVVLYLSYMHVPPGLWAAPVPVVGLAPDWNLLWHQYRRQLRLADLVLTDTAGVEALAREGIPHARAANLFGLERAFLEAAWPEGPRDLDVLFVGSLQPAVQRARLPWLARLAGLAGHRRVAVHQGVFGDDYRALLGRARIVFNSAIRGECNKRAFEAAAAGALLFQEADNREVTAYFRDRQECVLYRDEDLEELLEYYLDHEDERQALAEAGRERVRQYGFEELWEGHLGLIEGEWAGLAERSAGRGAGFPSCQARAGWESCPTARVWQALGGSGEGSDPELARDLATALVAAPRSAALHNALGLVTALAGQGREPPQVLAERAAGYFGRAAAADPDDPVAGLNLAEALALAGRKDEAVAQARRTLAVLDRAEGSWSFSREPRASADLTPGRDVIPGDAVRARPRLAAKRRERPGPAWLDAGHFPPAFDLFRVEWERAAWQHAGDPTAETRAKHGLLRWRLHALVAELAHDLGHAYEAVLARPDLPPSRALLGTALLHAGQPAPAVPHLRRALDGSPFDLDTARWLFEALGQAGDGTGQRRLAAERRLLARAAARAVPAEPWIANTPPVGDELVSLILLCCDQLDYTRLCLESVLRHTRAPYELVLVDNGSTDGTPAYLEEVRARPGLARVAVIRNDSNRGFPAGCNQGLACARGRYVVFLNNDTVVTDGWLDGLVAWALHDWPQVGLVGAVTNYASPPQQIPVDYADLSGLAEFAARRGRDYAHKALQFERLSGFCLLARREVLEQVGGFDERYGLGFFDDDDLCVRARAAGFRLLVALNVYVHHFGSRTFAGLGIDCPRQLRDNLAQFQAKWGAERAAGYHLPEETVGSEQWAVGSGERAATGAGEHLSSSGGLPTAHCPLPTVSLCLIAKNEEANLPACLESVRGLGVEVIVVDTGSTDRTKEIAASFGAKVVDFPWVDSFAAARNESLRHATAAWIFWLDADDRLDEANRRKLRALFAALGDENAAYVMTCLCLPDPRTGVATEVQHVRLFRNHPELRWRYRVHEQIQPAVRAHGGTPRFTDVVIQHTGYLDADLRARKRERDLRLLLLDHAEQPDDPYILFNLGMTYLETQPAEALAYLRHSLELSDPGDSIVRKLYYLVVQCHRALGQPAEALAACGAGRAYYPDDAELLSQEGQLRAAAGDVGGAEACFVRLLEAREGEHFASVPAGLRGYRTRDHLATLYWGAGRTTEAEAQWRAALAEQPSFEPAWLGLEEVYVAQGRWPELEEVIRHLEASPRGAVEAAVARARLHLGRREFDAARQLLVGAIARAPAAVRPRLVLSHVLLQAGAVPEAAEGALREVLALAPGHREASRNLALLRGARSRPA